MPTYLETRPVVIADTECFRDYWSIGFKSPESGRTRLFEYYDGQPLDKRAISSIFRKSTVITFNGIKYDLPRVAQRCVRKNDMNIYTTEFFATCPNNGVRIKYTLRIETTAVIVVEHILAATESFTDDFHEHIADALHGRFGGKQTLVADHHSVTIETVRTE